MKEKMIFVKGFWAARYIDVSRTTHTNLDVMQESRIDDYWYIDGSRDPERYIWSGRRLTKRQTTSRPDDLWPELWRGMARNA